MKKHKIYAKARKFNIGVQKTIERQTQLGKRWGLQPMTPPTEEMLLDPTGSAIGRREQQFYTRAGLESGRYLRTKNEQYIDNYISALEKFANKNLWEDTIERMKKFKEEKLFDIINDDFLGDVFPPLNDWYPSNKGYSKGERISYQGHIDIDLVSERLKSDIEWTLDILGVDKIKKEEDKNE